MKNWDNIEKRSPLEAALFELGPKTLGNQTVGAAVSDEDREAIAAFAEGRLNRAEEKAFRRRLSAEPALQAGMADFTIAIRGTGVGRAWLEGEAPEPPQFDERRRHGWLTGPWAFPRLALSFASGVVVTAVALFAVLHWRPDLLPISLGSPTSEERLQARLAQLSMALERGEIEVAIDGYQTILSDRRLPEETRRRIKDELKAAVAEKCSQKMARQEFAAAAKVAEAALKILPDDPATLVLAADSRLLALRQREGLPTWIGVERRKAAGERRLADASSQEEIDRVAGYYEKAAAADPDNVAALVGMSEVYFEQGRIQSAGKVLAQARWIASDDANVQNALGRLFIRKGRDDLAYDAFDRAIKANPDNMAARMNLSAISNIGQPPASADIVAQ